ncbi:MAG: NosD domain-containing protein [Thermoplasmata archaeon]
MWYAQPQTKIKVDGNIDDWADITKYTDTEFVPNPDINLNEYSVYYENERVYFYAKVSGTLFRGANNGYDALIIFVDTDGNPDTGYRIENLGADARIEISGYDGEIHAAAVSKFNEQSASSKPELNYSAWENTGEVKVEKTDKILEGYAKIDGLKNPVSLVVIRHYEGASIGEKRGMALVGKTEGSLVVYQNFIGNDVVYAGEDVLELRLIAKGKDVHVESLSVANASVSLPKKELAVNEEVVVYSRAKVLEQGKAFEFALRGVATDVPYRIVGNGGKAYYGSLPSGIVIDGAFGDWQGVEKDTDASGDASQNIDLREYASTIASKAYFYLAVDGTMLAGCEIPVLGARPPVQPGPPMPVVIKENLGMDVARVYIDLMNSTINTFNPAMISHGYLIELQGRNGQVVSARAWKWENGVKAEEIQNPNIVHGLSDGKIEFSVAVVALPGINNDTKFYFEMTNWLGEKDDSEFAYRAGKIQHQNTIANGLPRGTSRAPIHINGNSQFTGANGVVSGSGTQSDPYIIEGWEIDAKGGTYAIWIENTDVYFVIRNCTVYNATSSGGVPSGAGIALNNVRHGTLENNKCNNSRYGIYLYGGSLYNNITNNNASGNSYHGICLVSSSNNTINNNNALGNSDTGILLYSSSNNSITNNNLSGNSYHGIYLEFSRNNTIANNNASGNSYHGICLVSSSNNTINNNNALDNSNTGISLFSSSNYNIITNNNASLNSDYGIYLEFSSNNSITNNNASSNSNKSYSTGILLYSSSNNTITNNNVLDNSDTGIYLELSNNTTITYNWLCNNGNYGVYISADSAGNIIHHNNFIGNMASALRYLRQRVSEDTLNSGGRGVNGACQAYDNVGGNYWYDALTKEGNYWSNWDGQGWGSANAYPIAGGTASDWYPLSRAGMHLPIHITRNSEFTPENGVVGGSGTQSDPYIIEGWEIDANGGTYAIWIENTDAYFVIRNCTVYNATSSGSAPYGAGIALNNVRHGTLDSNKCNNSRYGIYLYGSSLYNNITNNNASCNSYHGIYMYSSCNNNTITNNNASGNSYDGIRLYSSCNNNTITNNNASDNRYGYGIYLYSSCNNTITHNNASNNSDDGIRLSSSMNNTIANNNASSNKMYGISLLQSSNNSITNNNVSGNSDNGIYLSSTSNNTITSNNACSNLNGIWLEYSSNNTITNNNVSSNRYGIYLYSSSNNNITYNWICNNTYYGVYITGSSTGNTIHHNNFIGNNGAGKGVNGNCQAYDDVGGNSWNLTSPTEGNYWSNWDGQGWGSANAYPIAGGTSSDWYPLGNPVAEFSSVPLVVLALACVLILTRVGKTLKKSWYKPGKSGLQKYPRT